ncbi:MAG: prolyl oligopeptidase family serine peptidase [Candidatus Kaiserbacteria bacterium]|nr:prolyl oligopeptidase family serine peptidase [Candidatus Kaiserbacteria bacterium]
MKMPRTKKEDIVDEIHGILVSDPYRWLESGDDEDVKKWVAEQNHYTDSFLKNKYQKKFSDELVKDFNAVEFSNLLPVKGRYFFTERRLGEDQKVLYVKDGLNGIPTKLVDPNELHKDHSISLDYWKPGWTGNYVAYGLSEGGDEMSTLYIIDVDKKENLQEKIVNCSYPSIQWLPDDSGFFYTRNPRSGTVPKGEDRLHVKVYFHELGSNLDDDPLIFGAGRPKDDKINLTSSIDGRYVAIHVSSGWTENEIYIYDREQVKVMPMIVGISAKFKLIFLSDKALLFTNYKANNYKVLSTGLENLFKPVDEWKEFFPEKENLLASVVASEDRVLLEYQVNACSGIIMLDYSGREIEKVPLPDYSHVTAITASRTEKEFFYSIVSFTSPRITYRFNPENQKFETYRTADNPIDPEQYITKQEWYASKDGTKIPMFIVHKKNVLLNGTNPTILYGYGGFGSSETSDFNRGLVPWLERGGIYAVANIRGGGEFGKEWHKGGIKENKQNSFDDFIAATEYLINQKYTDINHLGILGASNGGLLVSAVAVQRPDLFKAVCARVPLTDMVRFQKFGMAVRWVHEYGNPDIKEGLERILKWSPYHNVKEGVEYPNMLFITADKDTRVDPMHSRKITALLQSVNKENKILLFTETEAGHGAGKPVSKIIESQSFVLTFFARELDLNV